MSKKGNMKIKKRTWFERWYLSEDLGRWGDKAGVYLGEEHGKQKAANAKALSWEHVFCVERSSTTSF